MFLWSNPLMIRFNIINYRSYVPDDKKIIWNNRLTFRADLRRHLHYKTWTTVTACNTSSDFLFQLITWDILHLCFGSYITDSRTSWSIYCTSSGDRNTGVDLCVGYTKLITIQCAIFANCELYKKVTCKDFIGNRKLHRKWNKLSEKVMN